MIKFKFHEERDIINAVESNSMDFSNPRKVIWMLALYYVKVHNNDDKMAFKNIKEYIEEHNKDIYYEQYVSDINKCIRKAKKYALKNIDQIIITKSEMATIQSFNDIKKEKIVFVLIALAKYFNALYNQDSDCLFEKTIEIFKYALVVIPASERDYYLHFAYDSGVLLPNFSIGSNMQLVGVISHEEDDEPALTLNEYDYQELAYTYLNFKNGGYKRCAQCGSWFKTKTTEPGALYCHLHKPKEYESIGYKKCECKDCGEVFYVDARNMTKCRCDICQEKRDKEMKSLRNARYYEKHKN